MNKTIPDVSIVIPMYNDEKYIGACLDSIFAQTFQDFEVIVVDDCSTDNSRDVVEKYNSKFTKKKKGWDADKLQLIRLEQNSGGPSIPRNIGINISRADYITFVDSDDMITPKALEEFYAIAKKFDADVVACEKFFELRGRNRTLCSYKNSELVQEPSLLTENFFDRATALNQKEFIESVCMKLIRKEFLIKENLEMIPIMGEDALFTWCMLCAAEKYVLIPNITYIYRIHDESLTNRSANLETHIKKCFESLTKGFHYLNKFLNQKDFFKNNLEAKYIVFETLIKEFADAQIMQLYSQIPIWTLDEFIRREIAKSVDDTAFMTFLFSRMNVLKVKLNEGDQVIRQQQKIIRQLEQQLQK